MSMAHLMAYCLQLEMIRDRMEQHVPLDDEPYTASQRNHHANAGRFLKAACTSLTRLMGAYNEGLDNGLRKGRGRRGAKVRPLN